MSRASNQESSNYCLNRVCSKRGVEISEKLTDSAWCFKGKDKDFDQ